MMKVPRLGHPREVAHEDGLLADFAGLPVLEGNGDVQRTRESEIALTTLFESVSGIVKFEIAKDDGEIAGVILDGRDVVDRLPQHAGLGIGEILERTTLNVDQMWSFEGGFETGETPADKGGRNWACQGWQLLTRGQRFT